MKKRRTGNNTPGRHIAKADGSLAASRQLAEYTYTGDIMRPPYEPRDLIALIEKNDSLKQNIEALAVNVANFGHGIRYQDDFDYSGADDAIKAQADAEWDTLRRLYKHVNPTTDFSSLIYKMAVDMYSFGWGMLEIIRDGKGQPRAIEYCRACNFRLVNNPAESASAINVWEETEDGYEQSEVAVRFKKFVQIVNSKRVYFKEFGDRRVMSCATGEYSDSVPDGERATEIAYFSVHSSYSDYGVPSWINTQISASGNILSELLNYKYFQDARIIPSAILVSGGQLTESSIQAIENGKGIDNAYKTLILEASPFESDEAVALREEHNSRVSIDIKPLGDTNNKDALFRDYQRDGKEKIRDSLRLPPIYTGAASDYNRATADTARTIAEEQIFVPERKRICDRFNKIVNNELGIRYCELYLKGPDLSDIGQKADIITALNTAGAVTPNMLLPMAEEVLGRDLELWDEDAGNMPFELLKLRQQTGFAQEVQVVEKSADVLDLLGELTETLRSEHDDE